MRRDPLSVLMAAASIVLVVLFASLLASTRPSSQGREVALSEVSRLAGAHDVLRATLLDVDARVVLHTRDGDVMWAAYPSSDVATEALQRRLERAGAEVVVDQQAGKPVRTALVQFLLPVLLLACLFGLFARLGQDGGASGFMKFSKLSLSRARRRTRDPVTFAHVAGAPEAVAELAEIRDYLANPARYGSMGALPPRGVLLVGPPGTGKTLLARATAGEADASFFRISGAEFVESLVGVGAARVRDLFATARRAAPAIVFIDELDAAGPRCRRASGATCWRISGRCRTRRCADDAAYRKPAPMIWAASSSGCSRTPYTALAPAHSTVRPR
jgi:cell division protease FtsH